VGAFLIGSGVFFATLGVFTYLPYYLTSPPFNLSTATVSSIYLVYLAGVITSLASGRLVQRLGPRLLMGSGLMVAASGILITRIPVLAAVMLGLVALCIGLFMVQGVAPAFVNANAKSAKGGAGALYVSFYYFGASLGSAIPGYAWQLWGWWGVVASCACALFIGLIADVVLCR
jgi:YNFM family putative membrane transporter